MRQDIAAACGIGFRLAPVWRRLFDRAWSGVRDAAAHLLDAHPHALAWNRAGDEDNLPVVAGDHPTAGGGLLDQERQFVVS